MPSSKKDYVYVAQIINKHIRAHQKKGQHDAVQGMYDMALELCEYYAKDNPHFDDLKFLTACGAADQ